jgi:hypothetical protein
MKRKKKERLYQFPKNLRLGSFYNNLGKKKKKKKKRGKGVISIYSSMFDFITSNYHYFIISLKSFNLNSKVDFLI